MAFGRIGFVMVRRFVRVFAGVLFVWVLVLGVDAGAANDRYRLVWNDDPATTMCVQWNQTGGKNPVVRYDTRDHGRDANAYAFERVPARVDTCRGMYNHFARLDGLEPDRAYYFVIRDSEGTSERFWFRTALDSPRPFTFISGGDVKSGGRPLTAARHANRMVAKLRPLFVEFNGDFCSGDGTVDWEWQQWLDDWCRLATAPDGRMFPLLPVHGNHENGDREVLYHLFDTPADVDRYTYYALSFGGRTLRVIILNTELYEPPAFDRQNRWLERELAASRDHWLITAGYHQPIRPHTTVKPDRDRLYDAWAGLFHEYGVNLSFDAHSHINKITYPVRPDDGPGSSLGYIRDDTSGTMFLGEGSWGSKPRKNDDDKPWTLTSSRDHQMKWIHVHPPDGVAEGYLKIYTVVTGTRKLFGLWPVYYVDGVAGNTEGDVFRVPGGLRLHRAGEYGDYVRYPLVKKPEPPPSGVEAVSVTATSVDIRWSEAGEGTVWLFVEKQADPTGGWELAGRHVDPAAGSFTATGLEPDTRYRFRVRGHSLSGYSSYSATVPAATSPPARVGGS